MPLSDRQTQFLAEYHKSPRGTSVSEFVRQRGSPAYSTVMGWSKVEPEFKRRLQAIHREKYADVKVKRKLPIMAVDVRAEAPVSMVEPLAQLAAPVAEVPREDLHEAVAATLTPAQEAWLLAYTSNGFQVLAACQAAQMGYDEFEALVRANGPFSERFRAAERQMKQALRDKYLATALAVSDFDRVAVKELLKVYDGDTFNKPTSGTDSGAQNIWTIGLAMAGRKKVWADIFPGMDRRLPQ